MVKNLIPWKRKKHAVEVLKPFDEDPTFNLTRGMSDMVNQFFRRFDAGLDSPLLRPEAGFGGLPQVDVAETENEVTVSADLPGLDEKDIKVSLDGDLLTLRGERRHEHEEKKEHYRCMERSYGSFHRSVVLPEGIDRDHVKATFNKGVLTVRITKMPGAKSSLRHIPVQAG